MTPDDAVDLLRRINAYWSLGLRNDNEKRSLAVDLWLEELEQIAPDRAESAFARLKARGAERLAPAQFVAEARAVPIIEPPSDRPPGTQTGIALSDYLAQRGTPAETAIIGRVRSQRPLRNLRKLEDLEVSEVESSEEARS